MSNTTLFVCQSCHATSDKSPESPADGARLLEHLVALHQNSSRQTDLEIQPVGCLWTCDHPCAIALASPHKSTYVVANVPVTQSPETTATAVLKFSHLYLDSSDGTVPWKKFPEVLQTNIIARIPPVTPVTPEG